MAEYRRALQLDPEALSRTSIAGVTAQITSTEDRLRYDYMMAKIYAKLGNTNLRQDQRLAEIAPPPVNK